MLRVKITNVLARIAQLDDLDVKESVIEHRTMADIFLCLCNGQPCKSLLGDAQRARDRFEPDLPNSLMNLFHDLLVTAFALYSRMDPVAFVREELISKALLIVENVVQVKPARSALRMVFKLIADIRRNGWVALADIPEPMDITIEQAVVTVTVCSTATQYKDWSQVLDDELFDSPIIDGRFEPCWADHRLLQKESLWLLYCLTLLSSIGHRQHAIILLAV